MDKFDENPFGEPNIDNPFAVRVNHLRMGKEKSDFIICSLFLLL